jgi:alpha-glucoside transport system permease protein
MSSPQLVVQENPVLKAAKLVLLLAVSVIVLGGGFVFLKEYKDSKIILTVFAVVWGIGSTGLLYTVLNALGETFSRRIRAWLLPLIFAGPALLLLFWFLVLPTLRTLGLSFLDETSSRFVGLDNYLYAFTNSTMLESFGNNLLWLVFGTSGTVLLGLIIAVLADRSRWEAGFKALIFMPMAISFVGAGVIWKFIYAYKGEGVADIGLLNAIVVGFGGQPQAWLQLAGWNNFLLIIIMVWLQTGYAMVILSAAIKGIPTEQIEAGRVDGATEVQIFFRVIVPAIMGSLITVTTTVLIFSLKLFDIVRVMTGGNFGTNVVANQFYIEQFTYGSTGHASAIAVVLLIAIVPVLIYNLRQFAERRAFK